MGMTRTVCDLCNPANCPSDLCCYGECRCTPSAPGDRRWALRALGLAATALGLAGAALPLVPTTPFLLVAAWAFARSSPRLEMWLRDHPRLGPPLKAWEERRAIPGPAKAVAAVSLPASVAVVHAAGAGPGLTAAVGLGLACVGGWILTRPS